MVIATTKEQGQRLINAGMNILTADMHWLIHRPHNTLHFGPGLYHDDYEQREFPAWSLASLWHYVHSLDKTYEFSTAMDTEDIIEALVNTIEFRLNLLVKNKNE